MKRNLFFWLALIMVIFASPVWASDFVISSFSPQGEVIGKKEIRVSFSAPVVSDSMVGKIIPKDEVPLRFYPVIAGHSVWDNSSTLVFVPSARFAPATEYRVDMGSSVRDLSGQLLAGKQSFTFKTPALQILSVRQIEFSQYRELTLELRFSLPVPPKRLLGFVSATSDGSPVQLYPRGQVPAKRIILRTNSINGKSLSLKVERGLTSNLGKLGIKMSRVFKFAPSPDINITGSSAESTGEHTGRISFYLSSPVDLGDVKGYVTMDPEHRYRVEPLYGGFSLVGDFSPRDRIKVSLKKGLGGKKGLKKKFSRAYLFPDLESSVSFPVAGTFLSTGEDPRIAVETVNMNRLKVSAWRVYPNNIPLVMGALDNFSSRELSRNLGNKTYLLENRLNTPVRGALDIDEFIGKEKGVYLLEASDGDGLSWRSARQLITLTDMGISARLSDRSALIWVNSLSKAAPMVGANVTLYSSSNQVVAKGVTDKNGLILIKREAKWDPQLRPSLVTVEHGDDLSFLSLSGNVLSDSGTDLSGRAWIENYEALCFACRGIFRPGETVEIKSLVRSPEMKLPGEFPLLWKISNQQGQEAGRGRIELSRYGTGLCSLDLPPSASTGKYRMDLYVPGDERNSLGGCSFMVEDFTPPRLEISLSSDRKILQRGEGLSLDMSSSYLFGAPSSGLNWEVQVMASPGRYSPKEYGSYHFGDDEIPFEIKKDYIGSGVLDEGGKALISWTVPQSWKAPSDINLAFSAQVMQPGGRWVSQTMVIPCAMSSVHIGIESPRGDILPNKESSFRVVTLDGEGAISDVASLKASLYKVINRYVMVRQNNVTRMKWQEEKVFLDTIDLPLAKGEGIYSLTPEEGRYLVIFKTEDDSSSASIRFDSWSPWEAIRADSSIPDRVNLKLDRGSYRPGEEAKLSVVSPFPGRALFTLEMGDILDVKVLDLKSSSGDVLFDVPSHVWPNGWCTVQVVRPVVAGEVWGPHRAVGATLMPIETKDSNCRVSMDLPEKVKPGDEFKFKISVRNVGGDPLSGDLWVAIVDRGILGLTNYRTPSPWRYFTSRRRLDTRASDIYDELMPIESRKTSLLHPAGGDGEALMAMNLSPLKGRGFTVLSIIDPSVLVGPDGNAEISMKLPEFSGGARVMAVVSSEGSAGSAHADISISREIVVDPSMPRALAPMDEFDVPLQVISTSEVDVSLSLSIKVTGVLSITSSDDISLVVPAGKSVILPLKMRADSSGYGKLAVSVRGDGIDFEVERETVVRPPYPRVSISGGKTIETGVFDLEKEGKWFPGTLRSRLYLAGTPKADLLPLISLLSSYPFECLEQTVSSTWPLVALPGMVQRIDSELINRDEIARKLEDSIRRIQTMQLYDGSFSSWPSSGRSNLWGTLYAAHLMVSIDDDTVVPLSMKSRSLAFIRQLLSDTSTDRASLSRKAYGCYIMALAKEVPLGWMSWLSERTGAMDDAGRAFLAGSYGLAGKTERGLAIAGGWGSLRSREISNYGSELRDQAIRLLVMGDLARGSADEALLASALIRSMDPDSLSTQEAGFISLALGRYFERADLKPFKATVSDGDKVVELVTGDELSLSSDIYVPWRIENSGPGKVFFSWNYSGVPLEKPDPIDSGIRVRKYYENRDGNLLDLSKPLIVGQEVVVRIEVVPTGRVRDLAITDLLPGCLEVWSPDMYDGKNVSDVRKEVRFDRVLLFPSILTKTRNFGYRCRVIRSGHFTVPPVAAEGMYDLSTRSISGGGTMTVQP